VFEDLGQEAAVETGSTVAPATESPTSPATETSSPPQDTAPTEAVELDVYMLRVGDCFTESQDTEEEIIYTVRSSRAPSRTATRYSLS
jgi:hypothetical protein